MDPQAVREIAITGDFRGIKRAGGDRKALLLACKIVGRESAHWAAALRDHQDDALRDLGGSAARKPNGSVRVTSPTDGLALARALHAAVRGRALACFSQSHSAAPSSASPATSSFSTTEGGGSHAPRPAKAKAALHSATRAIVPGAKSAPPKRRPRALSGAKALPAPKRRKTAPPRAAPAPDFGAGPKERQPFPVDPYTFRSGTAALFVAPAFEDFLDTHHLLVPDADCRASVAAWMAAHCSAEERASGEVAVRVLDEAGADVDVSEAGSHPLQRIRLAHAGAGEEAVLTVPWLHVLADANEADPFLVKASHVARTCTPALVFAGRTFRAAFASAEERGNAEMHDGRVYEVARGHIAAYPASRYRSCRVLWYDDCAEDSTLHCAFFQTDCERSPWELLEARCASAGEREEEATRRALKAQPTVRTALRLLCGEDGARLLAQPPSRKACPRYYEVVEGQPVTLSYLRAREREGSYAHSWEPFWAHVETMIAQAKAFNQEERIEWRVADIMRAAVERIKSVVEENRAPSEAALSAPGTDAEGAGAGGAADGEDKASGEAKADAETTSPVVKDDAETQPPAPASDDSQAKDDGEAKDEGDASVGDEDGGEAKDGGEAMSPASSPASEGEAGERDGDDEAYGSGSSGKDSASGDEIQ